MSLLHYPVSTDSAMPSIHDSNDERFSRDIKGDMKAGLDLIFEFKEKLETFHPVARETLLRLLSY